MILCYPGVQEYNTAHWAFRRLAAMLARHGYHVLRFDWSGTGDSWGETTDGGVETWLSDLSAAAQEARDASGARLVSVVGMRLGAALAAIACSRGHAVQDLVLWDPVVRGPQYIDELDALDARENLRLLHRIPPFRDELVGFPFSPTLRRDIAAIDLYDTLPTNAKRVGIVSGESTPAVRELARRLGGAGVNAKIIVAAEEAATTNATHRESALLANRSLTAITDFICGRTDPG